MQNKSCPISFQRVDATVVRILSLYMGLLFTLFVVTKFIPIIFFLVLDFVTRIYFKKEYSLLFMLAKATKNLLNFQSHLEDNAPKRLASYFGLTFVTLIALSTVLNLDILFYALSLILGVCILLEVAFSYCLGCEVYHLYKRFSL